ncbi:MAG: hypothetical protein ACKOCT_21085 [Alphaproteobacteria bacterium]
MVRLAVVSMTLGIPGAALAIPGVMDGSRIQVDSRPEPNRDSLSVRGVVAAAPGTNPVADALAAGKGIDLVVLGSDLVTVVGSSSWGASICKALAGGRSVKCSDSSGRRITLSGSAANPGVFRVNAFVPKINLDVAPPFDLPFAAVVAIPSSQDWIGTTAADECKTQRAGDRAICKSSP